jgi:TonB family protein
MISMIKPSFMIRKIALLFLLSTTTIGCYRKDVDDTTNYNQMKFYRDDNGSFVSYNLNPAIYIEGKYSGLLASIYNHLEYPSQARANLTEGSVDIWIRIKPDGTVDEVIIKSDIGDGCGEAAAEAVRKATEGVPFEPTGLSFDLYGALKIYFELP